MDKAFHCTGEINKNEVKTRAVADLKLK